MPGPLLPIFPLSLVLLPRTPLPLHIFEERYKEMMGPLVADRGEFGVVLAKDGGVVNVGCTATVEEVLRRYPDGRMDLLTMGRRRFQIVALDEEKAYLRAEVEFFNDEDATSIPPALQQRAIAEFDRLRKLENEVAEGDIQIGEPQLSFQLARVIDDLDHRQAILAMRSERERLLYLVKNLPAYITKQEQIVLAKKVGPTNGHAKHYRGEE